MRNSNTLISYTEVQVLKKNAHKEGFIIINEDKTAKIIRLTIGYYDENETLLETRDCIVSSENYELLMSNSPDFAPGKPENEYREQDLWYIIDKIY
ncbi:hypothetical protein [Paenibacillus sp. Marseille-Q4541]|uniref:hypothetical protein n=1 Tax=Paenibacillus sp. Marseille-Q4541 TaxID=2831522 RepID=UPI001BA6FA81|nr:hypothetical protein [Paenibacillus sp. Marseille-Q4541]